MKRLLSLLVLLPAWVAAQQLQDPTRPPAALAATASPER
jgi:hypothetical protein